MMRREGALNEGSKWNRIIYTMIDFDYMILRLFILRIGKGKTDAEYRVAYGVVSPATSKMTEAVYTDFTTLGTFGKRCAWATILFASDTGIILSIY